MTDEQLAGEVLKGKLTSFEVLVLRYQKQILAHTYRLLRNYEDAEDATQETFLRTYQKLKSFDTRKLFRPWLYKIATNYCLDILRKKQVTVPLDEYCESDKANVLERIIQQETLQRLATAMASLPVQYLKPILGYYWAEATYETLAQALGLPVNTVRTRLRRGKALLATILLEGNR